MDAFQAALLHDLKTQVGTLVINAQLLAEDVHAPDVPDLAASLLRSARLAQALVLRLGDSGGGLRDEVVDLGRLVDEATEACRGPLRRRGVHLEVQGQGVPGRGDPTAAGQILANLLANACEAVPDGGYIRVTLSGTAIRVSDNGPGLAASVQPRLFEAPVSTRGTGRGLGLLGARHLARCMGGELHCCETAVGACFELLLRGGDHA